MNGRISWFLRTRKNKLRHWWLNRVLKRKPYISFCRFGERDIEPPKRSFDHNVIKD